MVGGGFLLGLNRLPLEAPSARVALYSILERSAQQRVAPGYPHCSIKRKLMATALALGLGS